MSDWAPFIPRTTRTTRSWSREEVRELNNALQLALEYFNIPKDANKSAAKAIEKRARGWSVRWVSDIYIYIYIGVSLPLHLCPFGLPLEAYSLEVLFGLVLWHVGRCGVDISIPY